MENKPKELYDDEFEEDAPAAPPPPRGDAHYYLYTLLLLALTGVIVFAIGRCQEQDPLAPVALGEFIPRFVEPLVPWLIGIPPAALLLSVLFKLNLRAFWLLAAAMLATLTGLEAVRCYREIQSHRQDALSDERVALDSLASSSTALQSLIRHGDRRSFNDTRKIQDFATVLGGNLPGELEKFLTAAPHAQAKIPWPDFPRLLAPEVLANPAARRRSRAELEKIGHELKSVQMEYMEFFNRIRLALRGAANARSSDGRRPEPIWHSRYEGIMDYLIESQFESIATAQALLNHLDKKEGRFRLQGGELVYSYEVDEASARAMLKKIETQRQQGSTLMDEIKDLELKGPQAWMGELTPEGAQALREQIARKLGPPQQNVAEKAPSHDTRSSNRGAGVAVP